VSQGPEETRPTALAIRDTRNLHGARPFPGDLEPAALGARQPARRRDCSRHGAHGRLRGPAPERHALPRVPAPRTWSARSRRIAW